MWELTKGKVKVALCARMNNTLSRKQAAVSEGLKKGKGARGEAGQRRRELEGRKKTGGRRERALFCRAQSDNSAKAC